MPETESRTSRCAFDLPGKEKEIAALERQAAESDFWNVPVRAQQKMRRLSSVKAEVDEWQSLDERAGSLDELVTLALEEKDDSLLTTFTEELNEIVSRLNDLEFKLVLSGEYDERNVIVGLHAGAGGVESQDWVRMLMRMYLRWAERRGFASDVLDASPGEEGGIKSAIVQISGSHAYGHLRAERGVHRLVRLSPFDANHARHTSFALVEALPEAKEGVDVTINPDEIRIDVFHASGHGGQSVQKNATAIRIVHLPTGIRVTCQNERSQHQNKEIAMKILTARLVERELQRRAEERSRLKGEHISPEWGNQIRSYVLHPYRMVKDHRTGWETSDSDAVLDGDIDEFIKAYLTSTVGTEQTQPAST